ncbi:relaxase/mobilization nuclease domain-containing protein [Pedobacter sp. LMG 31464]|uniref:Relaxase/mobilization nuclease domain-containing protein n=1 Tax=Pedobacter planticolens TaxID=2679964 RepID=A0A923IX46_9SPHI|nr:relaxase/mobilization nuclease domain-containing protein [Pedobacter planticolens]MBB2146789.1 relaxase/mobilization nuclease domain-containing protein [Pedobacter planticolens]
MVAKIKYGKSIRGILIYNETKVEQKEASIIMASGFAVDIDKLNLDQKIQRFKNLTDLNPTVKTNSMHISLNFDAADKLDLHKVQQIAQVYMEQIGFGEQPYIAYQHLDAAHPHIHIATTLMQKDGKRMYTHNMGRLVSEPARKAIELEFDLIKAEGRKLGNQLTIKPAKYGQKPTKQTINSIVVSVRRHYAFTSLAEFNAILGQFNIRADRGKEETTMFEKKGLLYSILDEKRNPIGVPIKASSFYDQPTLKNLEKDFQAGMVKRKPFKENLKKRIDWVMQKYNSFTRSTLVNELAKQQIALVFRQNEKGMIYGLTFVDHKLKTVFNGSDIGKDFSARAITEKFAARDHIRTYLKPNQATHFLGNPLEPLLEKADYDAPTIIGKKKKKKKSNQQNL